MNLIFLGPAGSGKSTLVSEFGKWLENEMKVKVGYVNLDPAAKVINYKADFDIREIFTTEDIMKKEGLGPNGAIIKSMELLTENSGKIKERINEIEKEILLIDTPGQLEPFIFKKGSGFLKNFENPIGIFLLPADTDEIGMVISKLMFLITQIRLPIPSVVVLSKSDKKEIDEEILLKSEKMKEQLEKLEDVGIESEVINKLLDAISEFFNYSRIVKVSAKEKKGFEELYDLTHEFFCSCGEL